MGHVPVSEAENPAYELEGKYFASKAYPAGPFVPSKNHLRLMTNTNSQDVHVAQQVRVRLDLEGAACVYKSQVYKLPVVG